MDFQTYHQKPNTVKAVQWFKNGDHPLDYSKEHEGFENGELRLFSGAERREQGWEGDVVRYFRHPDVAGTSVCSQCGKTMHVHGWIDTNTKQDLIVCPGDYVVTDDKGDTFPMKPAIFEATYLLLVREGDDLTWLNIPTNQVTTIDRGDGSRIGAVTVQQIFGPDDSKLLDLPLSLFCNDASYDSPQMALVTQASGMKVSFILVPHQGFAQVLTTGTPTAYARISVKYLEPTTPDQQPQELPLSSYVSQQAAYGEHQYRIPINTRLNLLAQKSEDVSDTLASVTVVAVRSNADLTKNLLDAPLRFEHLEAGGVTNPAVEGVPRITLHVTPETGMVSVSHNGPESVDVADLTFEIHNPVRFN